jgi:hypothetical protein
MNYKISGAVKGKAEVKFRVVKGLYHVSYKAKVKKGFLSKKFSGTIEVPTEMLSEERICEGEPLLFRGGTATCLSKSDDAARYRFVTKGAEGLVTFFLDGVDPVEVKMVEAKTKFGTVKVSKT